MRFPDRAAAAAGLTVSAAGAFLFVHLARDLLVKPLYEDEALAGLIAARPLPELIDTVMWDRGGAPLHFVLAHLALALDPSPNALRGLSVLFALATLPLCYDLGRRLAGPVAGATAAFVVAASHMLGIYGSFGRMYALLAFAGALAADLFVRALQVRTPTAAAAAAAAAWLLPAVHPYGLIPVGVEAAVALVAWRGRPLRAALPVAAIAVGLVPFVLADLRLADRFGVGVEGRGLLPPERGLNYFARTLRGFAGGDGDVIFTLFLVLALAGLVVVARRQPFFAGFAVVALAAPPVLLMVGRTGSTVVGEHLSVRHLIFLLPVWSALVGAGVARGLRDLGPGLQGLGVAAVAAVAVLAPPGGVEDPRFLGSGKRGALAEPSAFLRAQVETDDVLFPYSPLYLAALPATRHAAVLTRAHADLLRRGLERVEPPVRSLFLAVPLDGARLEAEVLAAELGTRYRIHRFRRWLLVEARGPFRERRALLESGLRALAAADAAIAPQSRRLDGYLRQGLTTLGGSL